MKMDKKLFLKKYNEFYEYLYIHILVNVNGINKLLHV
jgi:hypothetical protein